MAYEVAVVLKRFLFVFFVSAAELVDVTKETDFVMLITSDHGNAEEMLDAESKCSVLMNPTLWYITAVFPRVSEAFRVGHS